MYQAMQTGLVDGNENTESTFYDFKLYEVQKYLTLSSHGYVGYMVVANKKFWDGLPPDIRQIMEDAMVKTTIYANAISQKANETALEGIRKTGKTTVIALTPAEREEWKKVLRKTHEQMSDRIPKPLLQAIYKETGVAKP
jgi:C4-dicarboxylate-binding protein DctP